MLRRRIAGTEALTAIAFGSDRPVQKLAHDFVYQLCQSADQIEPEHAIHLSEQAVDLVAMALSERLDGQSLPSSTHRSALLYRLKAHIRAHLADPDLSLAATAAALGISPRYVNDLLSDEEDLVPALCADRAAGALPTRPAVAPARAPPCRRDRLRLGL